MKTLKPLLLLATAAATLAAPTSFKLDEHGALTEIQTPNQNVTLDVRGSGFVAFDVVAQKKILFEKAQISRQVDKVVYDSTEVEGLKVHAEFVAHEHYIAITGQVENLRPGDRAVILDYQVGLDATDATFSNALNAKEDHRLGDSKPEIEGSVFPIATLGTGKSGVAMAIPPDDPRIFGMVGHARNLGTRFYLGLSPLPTLFPNRATFSLIVFPSDPQWGFRGALEQYYSFYPERYQLRTKTDGLWLFQVKGIVPENITQYAFNVLEIQNKDVEKDLARDAQAKVRDLVYTLEGQREVKFLDKLPKDYTEAMAAYDHWTVEDAKAHPVTKENAPAGGDIWLKEEIANSAVKDATDKYAIQIRDTPWGRKSVSFKSNPSPYILSDTKARTVGKDSLELIDGWITQHPQIGGVLLDSYGANWPAVLDYRKDHFKYAQFPLTFDPKGQLAIHNDTGHYEFAKKLREKLDPDGRLLFANGIYAYKTNSPEHYLAADLKHRIKVGRFFDSALLDGASSEVGSRIDVERCQDVRVFMGRKYYAVINYGWDDPAKVEEFFNRSLCFDLFASNTKFYPPGEQYVEGGDEGISYVDNPNGYLRDKKLLDWFVPKARQLYQAGWEPVTHAQVTEGEGIYLERYGTGNSVYFTVFNDSADQKTATVEIDLAGLGFTEGVPDYKELARNVEPTLLEANKIKLTLEPYKTYIINMTKPWLVGMSAR